MIKSNYLKKHTPCKRNTNLKCTTNKSNQTPHKELPVQATFLTASPSTFAHPNEPTWDSFKNALISCN